MLQHTESQLLSRIFTHWFKRRGVMGKFMKQKRQIIESPTLKIKSSLERILLMTNKYGDKKPFN